MNKLNSNTTIEELDFSVRTCNCLKRHGINIVADLDKMTHEDLVRVRNIHKRGVSEIENKLSRVDDIIEDTTLEFKPNQIVFDRGKGWYGIYIAKEDAERSIVQFEFEDEPTMVKTSWLTHVDQVGVLKIIREYNELQQRGIIDLGNEFEY